MGVEDEHDAITRAILDGDMHVLRYALSLHTLDCESATEYLEFAAKEPHLEVVQFLHTEGGALCTKRAINWAKRSGNVLIENFLLAHEQCVLICAVK